MNHSFDKDRVIKLCKVIVKKILGKFNVEHTPPNNETKKETNKTIISETVYFGVKKQHHMEVPRWSACGALSNKAFLIMAFT